jgi:branched-chain amino acid transport system permease protein
VERAVTLLSIDAVTVVDGVAYGLLLFCVAAGLTVTFGVLRVLSLVHGTLYLTGAYLAWLIFDGGWVGLFIAVAVGLVVGGAAGIGLDAMMRPLAGRHLDQAVATLGVSFIAAEVFNHALGAQPIPVDPPRAVAGSIPIGAHSYPVWRLVFIAAAAMLAVALFMVVERTRIGAVVRAVVADRAMAEAAGIPTRRVQAAVMATGAALAVLAGVIGAPVLGPAPGVDTTVLVQSLIVVIVGGPGSIRGALLAALGVGMITTLGVSLIPTSAAFLLATAMLAALTLRPATLTTGVIAR